MRFEEAQAEADRRNREDPDRERFEFYPFDESAGMAADAWDVAARLRQGPTTARPATAAGARRAEAMPEASPPDPPAPEAGFHAEPVYEEPEPVYDDAVYAEPAAEPDEAYDDRPGFFVRLVGAIVILVGLAWLALVVTLALVLEPDDATSFAIYLGAAALGVLAMALGVVIRRS
ncbi:MAG TPA: hypothetical protein VNB64_02150 [Solirubrobacteraceae bacterium]|nr:hypothetical protein [Solirubrobacteraceae bacterium]